ncbi:ABC transporter substrate-binding protein [Paenibacillus nasutitermitis]|uniref:ABC-type glycerol-3-phosphate transport system, substrate-binding protein n=1 Tax=Paenibacillus nasutitermitis TaxID=1652958 RepID=A0A916ZD46_9BACL|nr:extracellular solute-binding protein [Paenibacillus nasutitermitis]GGD88866.1 hypothetical protein GCM10010911_54320 [Paenibacillus nasutitermitis]
MGIKQRMGSMLISIGLVSGLLTGCTGSSNDPSGNPGNTGGTATDSASNESATKGALKRTLRVVTFMEEDWGDQLRVAIENYKAVQPNAKIELESMPYQNYAEAIKAQMVGGISADLIQAEPAMTSAFESADGMLALDEYLDQPNPYSNTGKSWKEDFIAPFLDSSRNAAGQAKIVPWSLVWVGLVYNKDAYAKAGIAEPPATWNDFLTANEKLKTAGYQPFYTAIKNNDAQTWWMFQTMLNALFRPKTEQINLRHAEGWKYAYDDPNSTNGEILTVDELYVAFKKGLIDPAKAPEYRKALELMLQMEPHFNDNLLTADGSEIDPKFLSQTTAQKYTGTFGFGSLDSELAKLEQEGKSDNVFKWDAVNFPSITSDNAAELTAGGLNPLSGLRNGWVVSGKSEQSELAIDFLRFLTAADQVSKLYEVKREKRDNSLQPDASAVADVKYAGEAKKVDAALKYAELPIYGFGSPPVFDTGKDFEEFLSQWQGLWSKKLTIDEFLKKRSDSNLAALERNMKQFADQVDQAFIDSELN